MFNSQQMQVLDFCADEVKRQYDTSSDALLGLVKAWTQATEFKRRYRMRQPDVLALCQLAHLVKPEINKQDRDNFRRNAVYFGPYDSDASHWSDIRRQVEQLCAAERITPGEFYQELMRIHPWVDGNGRVGCIVWNMMMGMLENPEQPPPYKSRETLWATLSS